MTVDEALARADEAYDHDPTALTVLAAEVRRLRELDRRLMVVNRYLSEVAGR
jgi:hypothetical protein